MTAWESDDPYYDLFEDWDLIVSSFLSQYGLSLSTKEFNTVSWGEFRSLLAGISPDTVLGRVVAIRSENDKNILKLFTPEQKRIRNEWRERRTKEMPKEAFEREMAGLEKMFAAMFG